MFLPSHGHVGYTVNPIIWKGGKTFIFESYESEFSCSNEQWKMKQTLQHLRQVDGHLIKKDVKYCACVKAPAPRNFGARLPSRHIKGGISYGLISSFNFSFGIVVDVIETYRMASANTPRHQHKGRIFSGSHQSFDYPMMDPKRILTDSVYVWGKKKISQ